MKQNLSSVFLRTLGCDLRSLAALRVGIALILLMDLINRSVNFYAFHSEFGVFPQAALKELWGGPWFWSLNYISTGDWWAIFLLIVNYAAVLLLLAGWKTRFVTVACWILQVSLQARTPLILQSGDVLLRLILFWAMFLPWGAYYSVDSALDKKDPVKPLMIRNGATVGLTLQALYVYFFAVFLKNGKPWTTDGSAVYLALHIDQFATPLAVWLRELPYPILRFLSFAVYYFELVAPIAALIPWKNGWIRVFILLGLWCMHLGFGAGLDIGNFVWISIFSTVGLIPSCFWERYTPKTPIKGHAFFDEDCGFCIRMVEVIKTFLILPSGAFRPAQSDKALMKILESEDSWIFKRDDGTILTRSRVFRELLVQSPLRLFSFLFLIPGAINLSDRLYRIISKNRDAICDPDRKPFQKRDSLFELSAAENAFCFFVISFISIWNVGTIPGSSVQWAQKFEGFAYILRIDQKWEMFAPFPLTDDGWYLIKGQQRNGNLVDPLTNEPPTEVKPLDVRNTYKDFRWRKYMMSLWAGQSSGYRMGYGRYLCRKWNSQHPSEEQLLTFDIVYMREDTPPPGASFTPAIPVTIWTHNCYGK